MKKASHVEYSSHKLALHRETLRRLDAQALAGARGGLMEESPPTPSCPPRPTTI